MVVGGEAVVDGQSGGEGVGVLVGDGSKKIKRKSVVCFYLSVNSQMRTFCGSKFPPMTFLASVPNLVKC